ncbi:hypothetical protein BX600DRAFT_242984 [Xylariales sp. PMI_506]|nr:hypothetical protein BX600DRAFT_242984 [Xylariales sp. PMI_506]
MTEPENFEDDLFADLYDDNDASAAAAPTAAATAPPPVPAPVKQEPAIPDPPAHDEPEPQYDDQQNHMGDENGYGGEYADNEEPYDDDDDVDFNLGNGASSHALAPRQEEVSTPTFHTNKGPSAKEDG